MSARSKPLLVPSRSIEVNRISPAPSATTSLRIGKRIEAGRLAPAMGENFPFAGAVCFASIATTMHWLPNFSCRLADDLAVGDGGGHDRHFVCAGEQQRPDVVERAHAAADGERHEAGFRRALDDIEDDRAVLMAGGDVEETEFVGARRVIGDRALDRIAGIAQIDKIHALDDAAIFHVETRNDAGI